VLDEKSGEAVKIVVARKDAARGLTGSQGVLIPSANVQHLMLREDVVQACADGRFAVYPIACIEEGVALLTGLEAGERQADGTFPPGSVNRRVEDRLPAGEATGISPDAPWSD
jgi:predicted ATP-dependent protease